MVTSTTFEIGRIPAGSQARAQPGGRRPDLDVAEQPADVPWAALEVLDPDVDRLVADLLRILARRRSEVDAQERGHVAREAVDREEVGPVVRDLQLENRLAQRQHVAERRSRLAAGEDEDAAVVVAQLELALREDHPVGDLAAQLGALELRPARQDGARQGDRDRGAGAEVPRAADDLPRLVLPHVDAAELEPVGIRVLSGLEHPADAVQAEVSVDVGDADPLEAFDDADRDVDARGELLQRQVDLDVFLEPAERDLHG